MNCDSYTLKGSSAAEAKIKTEMTVNDMIRDFRENHQNKERRVLLIEHNCINQMIVIDMLLLLGISSVETVSGCEECNKKFENQEYDMILVDVLAPCVLDFLKEVNGKHRACLKKIVGLTTSPETRLTKKCDELGVVEFLSVPVSFKQFISVLEKYFD